MRRHFDPALVNDSFDDPGLYVDLIFERRALLFDLGDIGGLPTRKLLRISDVFVTHRHMDHFAGFDQLLRRLLGREKSLGVYGPAGLIDALEHKLKAYTWNLIEGYDGELVICATEVDCFGNVRQGVFRGRSRFERSEGEVRRQCGDVLLEEPGLRVRAIMLDHGGVPVLAYALEERAQINIWRNKAEGMVEFSALPVRDTTEPFALAIRENLGIGQLPVAENAHKQKLKTRSNQALFEKLSCS